MNGKKRMARHSNHAGRWWKASARVQPARISSTRNSVLMAIGLSHQIRSAVTARAHSGNANSARRPPISTMAATNA